MPEEKELMQDILTKLIRIETLLDSVKPQLDDHEARIRELEGKSGKRWDSLSLTVISTLIAGIVGLAIGRLF